MTHIVIAISVIQVMIALVTIVVVVDSINQWYNELYNAKFSDPRPKQDV